MANFKQKGVWFLPLAILMMLIGTVAVAFARTAPGTTPPSPPKLMSQRELNANAWQIYTTNYGPFVNPQAATSGGFWPRGSGRGYIYGAGLWVGATDAFGNKIVACGYNPNSGQYETCPVDADNNYGSYLSDSKIRVYMSTDPVDVADWPVTEGGVKVIKSRQDSYARYSDESPTFTFSGEKQLGVLIEQFSYAWNYADNNDIIFFYFKVTNISGTDWTKVYVGPGTDCDIGDEGGEANDRCAFDFYRNLAIQYQEEVEGGWPETGCVGFRYFESPINNTGATVHIVDNQFTRDVLPDSALGMTAFKVFTLDLDPATDEQRYLEMTGINYWDMVNDAYDEWGANTADDKRFMMSSGPFNLANGASATTCIGALCALDTITLKNVSDVAQIIYNNGFELATPPAAPTLTITPGDKFIRLSWDKRAEITPDPYWIKLSATKDWYTYFPGSWAYTLPATRLLVDSFEIKVDTLFVRIARGDPNPIISIYSGTDTVKAFYSQQEMYNQYDFQGYIAYRARTQSDLASAEKREFVGALFVDTDTMYNLTTLSYGGGSGYMYDKIDGIKIVRDLEVNRTIYPGGSNTTPKYDTLGTDRGLVYSLTDSNVINGVGYWYGVSAYDYQSNVFLTHKCPTTLISNPTENSGFMQAYAPLADVDMASLKKISVTGNSDLLHGGMIDYSNLRVAAPDSVKNDTFWMIYQETTREIYGLYRNPIYKGYLYDSITYYDTLTSSMAKKDTLLDTVKMIPRYDPIHYRPAVFKTVSGDEIPFGYGVFRPNCEWTPVQDTVTTTCYIDSVRIIESPTGIRTYPADSVKAVLIKGSTFSPLYTAWQWRGSDYEIRWRDTLGTSLTCDVWDITNQVYVPFEPGVTKANMVRSSWCFNPTSTTGLEYISGTAGSGGYGLHIAGVTLYFNYATTNLRKIDWVNRPETGDIWRVFASGPTAPMEGDMVTFVSTKAKIKSSLSASLLDKIKVVPNPYLVRANWDVSRNYPIIYFTNLPSRCTIRIYNLAGDLIRVLNHDVSAGSDYGAAKWDLLTTYDKRPASGVYVYQIDAPGIGTKLGKFAIIK